MQEDGLLEPTRTEERWSDLVTVRQSQTRHDTRMQIKFLTIPRFRLSSTVLSAHKLLIAATFRSS